MRPYKRNHLIFHDLTANSIGVSVEIQDDVLDFRVVGFY